jgi:hypothetical protein
VWLRSFMCAAFELNETHLRPGRFIGCWKGPNVKLLAWAGFAKSEALGWWKKKGGELVDIPAHRFAERSDRTRQLIWGDVPAGQVIRGLIDPNDGKPVIKVVTRASTEEEQAKYEHPRMPVITDPLYSAEPPPLPPEEPRERQGMLF